MGDLHAVRSPRGGPRGFVVPVPTLLRDDLAHEPACVQALWLVLRCYLINSLLGVEIRRCSLIRLDVLFCFCV